jgi:nicotinate-nucleotide adenylyltransferase
MIPLKPTAMRKKRTNKRVGIFGGLFDPPHVGHLIIAQSVLEEFFLDTVFFVPAGNPPHKSKYSSFKTRYAMIRHAVEGNKKFILSDIENRMPGKTYTIDVIREFKMTTRAQLYLIIGSDQWSEIRTWRAPQALRKECNIVVVPRTGYRIRKGSQAHGILVSKAPRIDISSTLIRKHVRNKKSIQYLVTAGVHTYIRKHRLYRR